MWKENSKHEKAQRLIEETGTEMRTFPNWRFKIANKSFLKSSKKGVFRN